MPDNSVMSLVQVRILLVVSRYSTRPLAGHDPSLVICYLPPSQIEKVVFNIINNKVEVSSYLFRWCGKVALWVKLAKVAA